VSIKDSFYTGDKEADQGGQSSRPAGAEKGRSGRACEV